jgi:hypothetical protein
MSYLCISDHNSGRPVVLGTEVHGFPRHYVLRKIQNGPPGWVPSVFGLRVITFAFKFLLNKIQTAQYLKSNVMFTLREAELPLSQIISLALDGAGPMFKVRFSIFLFLNAPATEN